MEGSSTGLLLIVILILFSYSDLPFQYLISVSFVRTNEARPPEIPQPVVDAAAGTRTSFVHPHVSPPWVLIRGGLLFRDQIHKGSS